MDGVHSLTSPFSAEESEIICFTFWAPEKLPFEENAQWFKRIENHRFIPIVSYYNDKSKTQRS